MNQSVSVCCSIPPEELDTFPFLPFLCGDGYRPLDGIMAIVANPPERKLFSSFLPAFKKKIKDNAGVLKEHAILCDEEF